jgi:N-acetylneuraminic acid mutarotase
MTLEKGTVAMRRCGILLVAILLALGGWSTQRSPLVAQQGGPSVLYRVNAGGSALSGTPNWSADTDAAPSPYVNTAAAGNKTASTSAAINLSHPSLPAGTPASLLQTERWDRGGGAEMQWSFPVAPGSYEVRLYFAEIYFTSPGQRVFSVSIEGNEVLPQYDIVADVGSFTGVMKSFTVTADATVDILFSHVVENPKISGIEIVDLTPAPGEIGVSPESVEFGSVLMGQTASRTLQLTNLGGAGDPSIGIYATTITGTDALQFSDSFSDGTTVTLAPGQSTSITVLFSPAVAGANTAALEISHFGSNSPVVVPLAGTGASAPAGTWQSLAQANLSRHEISYVQVNGNFYLTGDRGQLTNEVYNAASNSWSTATPLPTEHHHAQAVELNGLIYYLGGLVGPYPDHVTPAVDIFNPASGVWTQGTPMPASRARGAGGTALHNGLLYVAGGLRDDASGTGHEGVSVNLFDVYNPATGTWMSLPNMPRARDHFHAAVVGNKFYAIAGRKGDDPDVFNAVIAPVDVYDFTTNTWSTLPAASNLPTPRAGTGAAVLGDEIVIIGGEGNGQAWATVEAFNTSTGTWRTLAPMPTARHGIQAAVCNGGIYVAGGGLQQGGGSLTNAHQVFFLGSPTTCGGTPPPPSGGYRVNAGGPVVSGTPNWSGDTNSAPSPYSNASATATAGVSSTFDTSHPSLPAGTPATLFQTERYDPAGGAEMQWTFPVAPGNYEVRLFFAEIYFTNPGERVFNVAIEGTPVLGNYDIVADVGAFKGVMKSFIVTADASLDIAFGHIVENPKVSAIEIVDLTTSPNEIGVSPQSLDFGTVQVGQTGARTLQLTNLGGSGDPDIVIDATTITGSDASQFSDNFNDAGIVTLAPGQSTTITVNFTPAAAGAKSAALQVTHSGLNSPTVVPLSGTGSSVPTSQQYRVNAGGPVVSGTPNWSADSASAPSPYGNGPATGNETFVSTATVDVTHPSLPTGTPASIFQSERWDPASNPEMLWSFPVTPGSYEVRLYFAEIWFTSPGDRVFNVTVEGTQVLTNYDIVADVGSFKGVMKSFIVTADASLDIVFGHVFENPKISAIEILDAAPKPGEIGVFPQSVDFGTVVVGQQGLRDVQVRNLGGAGDPDIVIDATTITGTHAGQFGDNFNDAGNVTLAPGQVTTITATFAPSSTGTKTAAVQITHSGVNNPTVVPLSGVGSSAPVGAWQTLASSNFSRHELSYVQINGKFYLTGDRGFLQNEVYNPATNTWSTAAPLPEETHHTQAVALNGLAYYLGGLAGPYPDHVTPTVKIFNPTTNSWSFGTAMPPSRARGAGGAAAFNGKIYVAGGLQDDASGTGHEGTSSNLFDVYDPVAGTWTALPNMPRARDHFHAAVVGNKFFAIAGRKGDEPGVFNAVIALVDVYDFTSGTWSTLAAASNLPTPRAGTAAAVLGSEILIIGGEGNGQAWNTVEAFDATTGAWRTLASMPTARHGIQAAVCNGGIYVAGGGLSQGGDNPSKVHQVFFLGTPTACGAGGPVGFGKSTLAGTSGLSNPTSLQFGPDGRLYVGQQNGLVRVYTVTRNTANSYAVTLTETITSIQSVPNHNDDGQLNLSVNTRLITGILVAGTASNPVIYVAHSDPRIGGENAGDLNLDTNSSMVSRLTWTGSTWQKLDLVRGLPRSEENHAGNGMQLDPVSNVLYLAMGGNTNKGAPSNYFAHLPEFALSAAVLSIDLTAIGNTTYDLPTLDDETRAGNPDFGDPFGGNNAKNQAKLVPGGPVQVYAPGFRNPYDLLLTQSGRLYTVDNGGNAGGGNVPVGEGPSGTCTNADNEPGTTSPDSLHQISAQGYYGGHPNPTRGNTANTFNPSNPQSPVPAANPVECDYREAGAANGALATFSASTNGLTEYTADNFGGAMQGNLLAASFNDTVYRVQLDVTGTTATQVTPLFSSVGNLPLDVVALGPIAPFPGTIWVALYGADQVLVYEPNDFDSGPPPCTGADDPNLDEDLDGYDNADEIDSGTSPCSAADVPPDWDHDFTSDLNDADDDNDGTPDVSDPFPIDASNGAATQLPVVYEWENDGSNPGGILNLGFTGLMINGVANYATLYDPTLMTAGGAGGSLIVDQVSEGDAFGSFNTQEYAFQFGLSADPASTDTFVVHTRILGPFAGLTPQDGQSMGLFIGTGDQDNYAKVVVSGTGGGGIAFLSETGGVAAAEISAPLALPGPNAIDLYLRVDPDQATVQPFYSVTSGGVTGPQVMLAPPQPVPAGWFTSAVSGLAVGIISTSRGPAPVFPANWDFIMAVPDTAASTLAAAPSSIAFGNVAVGQSGAINLQLTNQGSSNLVVDATSITGTNAGQFSDTFNDAANVTLGPGASTTITVTFAPTSTGSKTATLSIAHSGTNTPLLVPLGGSGVTQPAPTLGVSPGSLAFGNVIVAQSSGLNLQLTNQGTSNLVVDATTITGTDAGQFSDNFNDAANVTLGPGASTTVVVTFAPTSTGSKTATLSIAHSGSNTPVQVPLSGTGTTTPTGQQVTHFSLINADTEQPVSGFEMLTGGQVTLDLTALPTRNLNLRAHTSPDPVGSVRFGLDGNASYATENGAPYALAGDSGGNYKAWSLGVGAHTVTATPYTGANAGGTAGAALTIGLTIVDGVSDTYRVNAGGSVVSGTPNWSADTSGAPSTYVNAAATGNKTAAIGTAIDTSHPSLPAGTPGSLFQSERWDPAGGAEMQWSFPVPPGSYEVRIYFAEIYFTSPGQRAFDVFVEGNLVLDNYDIVADVGARKGVMKSFIVTSDSFLNVVFGHAVENPKVSAIEIRPVGGGS